MKWRYDKHVKQDENLQSADPEGVGTGDPDPPLKKHKNIGFLSNTVPDPLIITKLPSQHPILGHHCWLVGFVALRPMSTAMVIAGRSVHLTTLFPGQA